MTGQRDRLTRHRVTIDVTIDREDWAELSGLAPLHENVRDYIIEQVRSSAMGEDGVIVEVTIP